MSRFVQEHLLTRWPNNNLLSVLSLRLETMSIFHSVSLLYLNTFDERQLT